MSESGADGRLRPSPKPDPLPSSTAWTWPPILHFHFSHSTNPRFYRVLDVAREGHFHERFRPGRPSVPISYETAFDLSIRDNVQRAWLLAIYLRNDKGVEVSRDGRIIPTADVVEILRCYLYSFETADHRAYCWRPQYSILYEDWMGPVKVGVALDLLSQHHPTGPPTKTWFSPCRLLRSVKPLRLSNHHPCSLRDQVEAELARAQCRWCPRLDLDRWEPLQWGQPEHP